MRVPTYDELLSRTDAPPGSSWGLFGAGDELGTINFMDEDSVRRGLACARTGDVIGLDHAINAFQPPLGHLRQSAEHHITSTHPHQRDDYLDRFYLQGTSQIDGLRHRRQETHGFYNRVPDDAVRPDTPTLGINRWAQRGIAGRGILADLDGYLTQHRGHGLDHAAGETFSVEDVERVLASSALVPQSGDILLIRTGFARFYREHLSDIERAEFAHRIRSSGLIQSHETLGWIWDHQLALVASDNLALEAVPPAPSSPFPSEFDGGLMHQQMIALIGLAIGELWDLDDLATACRQRGEYDFLITAKPLNLIGGVGSPANALAIL